MVLLTLVVIGLAFVLVSAIYCVFLASEERKQEAQRKRFERVMQASTPPPRAPGLSSRRIS